MRRLLLILFCAGMKVLVGQTSPNDSYRVFTYSTENGLPSNGVKGMEWDEASGFLWIATEAGLSRFNGIDFANFTRANTRFISSERMRFMVRNGKGEIRAADMSGNVFSIAANQPNLLHEAAKKEDVWVNKLVGCAISDQVFEADSIPSPNWVSFPFSQVFPRGERSAYMLNQGGTLVYLNLEKNQTRQVVSFGNDNAAGFVLNGAIYLVKRGNQKIFRLDEETQSAVPSNFYLPTPTAITFWESGMSGPVFIDGNRAWILRIDNSGHSLELICNAVPNLGLIKYVQYSEKRGLLFLGTASRGFAVVRTNRVSQIRKPDFTPKDVSAYYSQWEWKPGTVLTNEGHVLGRPTKELRPIPGDFGFSIYEDGDSLIWYSSGRKNKTGNVLYRLDRRSGERKMYERVEIFNVFAFSRWKGQVVIGNHRGLGLLEGDSLRTIFKSNSRPNNDPIAYNLLELEPGVFSMTTCDGWIRFDLNTQHADTLLKLPGYCIRAQTRVGEYVFIGTYGKGIYLYHRGKITAVPIDKNEFLLYTHCFVVDNEGFVWMSSNRGLFKAAIADMLAATGKGRGSVYYHYFGRNDGMEMTELNGGCAPCAATLSDGTLSFPSMDGLLWVNPKTAKPLLPSGPIYIDGVQIDEEEVGEIAFEEKTIPRSHRSILLRIGFSAWCNPENIYLDYQLNDSTKWIPLSVADGPNIRLNNLPPGQYTLRIRKSNGFGENNFSIKTLRFEVGRAWYDQPMFYLFCALGLIIGINLFSRYQNRRLLERQKELEALVSEKTIDLQEQNNQLEKNNRIKSRLISIISHDIVTPLKFLTVAGRGLKENKKQLSESEQQETLTDITDTAQELQLLSTNILNWIKYQNNNSLLLPESVSPHQLTEQVFGLLKTLAKAKNMELVNEIDPGWQLVQFAEPLKILIYNLVSNSIRYSDRGTVRVGAEIHIHDESRLWVSDEGVGMSQEVVDHLLKEDVVVHYKSNENRSGHGLGFLIIKDLVRWVGGRIDIQSEPDKGTRVSIFIRPRAKQNPMPT